MTARRPVFRRAVFRRLVFAALGYAAACATVSALYILLSGARHDGVQDIARTFLTGILITGMTAFPGYAALRLALWATASGQLWRFALAGGANGLIALSIFSGRPVWDSWFVGMGLAAGTVYGLVERRAGGWAGAGTGQG
jgi:hypothetical protein